jgi:uncharacterized protein (TIGR03083 family)
MTTTTIDIDRVSPIEWGEEAASLATAAYEALLADLETLAPDDWRANTVCPPWTVADMVRHLVGAAKSNASMREMVRQQLYGARHKSDFDGNALDATNHLQVTDHQDLDAAGLTDALRGIYPHAVRGRMRTPALLRRVNVSIDVGGSTADGMPAKLNMGHLMRVIYTRDIWLHRIDIARAVGREPSVESRLDGRIISDVVKEWSDRHGQPFDLTLNGPAGGRYVRAGGGPEIELDAVEFAWVLSGRAPVDTSLPGAEILSYRVLF